MIRRAGDLGSPDTDGRPRVVYANEGAPPPRRVGGLDRSRPLPVWRLAEHLRDIIAGRVRPVWVVGEVVAPRITRGTLRFTLRDSRGHIECVRWAAGATAPPSHVVAGMMATALVTPRVFTRPLSFACVVSEVHQSSKADTKRKLESLRDQLAREGLFADTRKRKPPVVPECVGVITSRDGAAWHDVLAISRDRHPGIPLVLIPAQMQGNGAERSIVAALHAAAASSLFDVLIVTRGGGSAHDLDVFNSEMIARAVAASPVPVVTAIGHETDFTIADAVADARAATPSAAATLVTPLRGDIERQLRQLSARMIAAVDRRMARQGERLQVLGDAVAHSTLHRIATAGRDLDRWQVHLTRAVDQRIAQQGERFRLLGDAVVRSTLQRVTMARLEVERRDADLNRTWERRVADEARRLHGFLTSLKATMRRRLERAHVEQESLGVQLTALNPASALTRGFAIVRGGSGMVLSSVGQFSPGQPVDLELADGTVRALIVGPTLT